MYFDELLLKSTNKPGTTWSIVKTITSNRNITSNNVEMNINNTLTNNPFTIANAFNSYFSSVAENFMYKNDADTVSTKNTDPLLYLKQNFKQTIFPIRLKNTSTHEVEKIIHSLKSKN